MFDNLKKIQQLKAVKDSLEKERVEVEKEGTRVVFNGKMKIEELSLNSSLDQQNQERVLRECINEAVDKIQMIVAKQMMKLQ